MIVELARADQDVKVVIFYLKGYELSKGLWA